MYSSLLLVSSIFASMALGAPAPARPAQIQKRDNSTANNLTLVDALELAPTAATRAALLPNNADWLFDFQNPPATAIVKGQGGMTVRADRLDFPALIGTGVSMTLGFLGPCGFNTPHTHPRSSEINVCVQGNLVTEFIAENGVNPIINNVTQFQMTVFPQGAVHTEFNPDCTESIFVAGFASEDPGVQQSAQTFFGLEDDIVAAALGQGDSFDGKDLEQFRALIPPNVALGVESCLQRCGIKKV